MKIMIAGEGGQGVQVLTKIIADSAYKSKYNISYIPHYGVEMRMGISFAFIQLSKSEIYFPKFSKAEILALITKREIEITKKYIDSSTRIINALELNKFVKSKNLSNKSLNMLVLGILVKELNTTEFRLDKEKVAKEIEYALGNKQEILKDNLKAFELGVTLESDLYTRNLNNIEKIRFKPYEKSDSAKSHVVFPEHCKGCGLCLEICPVDALSWSKTEINYINRPIPNVDIAKCISCLKCQQICPDVAIKVVKKK